MRLLDKLHSSEVTETVVKDYMKLYGFLGVPEHICNGASEMFVYVQNFIVFNAEERTRLEELFNCEREEEWAFPLTISKIGEQTIYSNKTEDFASYNANTKILSVFLIQKFSKVIAPAPKLETPADENSISERPE